MKKHRSYRTTINNSVRTSWTFSFEFDGELWSINCNIIRPPKWKKTFMFFDDFLGARRNHRKHRKWMDRSKLLSGRDLQGHKSLRFLLQSNSCTYIRHSIIPFNLKSVISGCWHTPLIIIARTCLIYAYGKVVEWIFFIECILHKEEHVAIVWPQKGDFPHRNPGKKRGHIQGLFTKFLL